MTAAPPVTVGVPVYNGEDYLAEALTSLRDQTFGDFEVIVADNASSDGTEEIARDFTRADDRFRYVRHDTNIGGAHNSNYLLDATRSPYFRWAYHDDVCSPELLERSVKALEDDGPRAVVAYPRVVLIDEGGERVGEHDDADLDIATGEAHDRVAALLSRVVGQVQFGLMRTDVAREAGGVVVSPAGEMLLPLALALRGRAILVPEQLLAIRVHEDRAGGKRESEIAWVDPSRPRMAFPYSRSTPLMCGAVLRAPIGVRDKARCIAAVLWHWTRPGWRTFAGDVVRLPQDLGLRR
ncbi:glycosyltransferase family 2 protein [Mumia sp. DW29H23]|uniref:glycosyltransferase family 2 protein n=1 Tax=Mumia sp. DW29H23 TaxID=3421241 RepID=UPI003D69CDE6